jgi:protein-L-isoaspartate(D-aspartate) O-methyltransferase
MAQLIIGCWRAKSRRPARLRWRWAIATGLVSATALWLGAATRLADPTADAREQMVRDQIESRGVAHLAVLRAMRAVPRHLFVPAAQTRNAYADRPLPIGYGQTISQPYIVAYMTEVIRPRADHKVLEIGSGSGYQAAVLAEIVAEVSTIEIVPELARWARDRLDEAGYAKVAVRHGDGYHGWPEKAPFDAIVVTAAAPHIPPPLIEQLKDGGRMIIPVGSPFLTQQLVLVEKRDGQVRTRNLMPVRFVPFTRAEE